MMSRIALIGKKLGMTTMFDNDNMLPVTLIKVLPNVVVGVRNYGDKCGIIIGGNEDVKDKKINKPQRNSFLKNSTKFRRNLKEFKINGKVNIAVNTEMAIGDYLDGAVVDVRSRSSGKGFQGAMKRWGFAGLPASHGVSLTHRSIGSTGNRTLPGRVFKGKKMPGRMGGRNICVQNMVICKVDKESNVIAIKGSVPGKENSVVYITSAVKKNTDVDNVINGLVCES